MNDRTLDRQPAARAIDPITLSVLWNRLLSITEEMGSTLRRTAFSEAVREGDDFSTGLFDRHGRLVAQGNFTPGHTGSMPFLVKSVLKEFPPETLEPGDSILTNDSYLGSGHFPDMFLVTPVFRDRQIIGFTCNTAHHVDVGGQAPGSQEVKGVTDAVQEGIRILPVRALKKGEFDRDVIRIILGNVRLPEKVFGDLKAQRNANFVGARRLVELFENYGGNQFDSAVEEILTISEERMRARIRQLPEGTYAYQDVMDDAGVGSEPIRFHCQITIKDGTATLDFSGSSDQVPAGINSYINYTNAYGGFAFKVLADAVLPQNDGAARAVRAIARPGSFFNPQYPAPSGGRAAISTRMFEVINGALKDVLPERVMGAFSQWANPNISGTDDRTGKPFVQYDLIFAGYGGQFTKDGIEALSPVMNCTNIPVEVMEATNPILVRQYGIIPDSCGAGKFRGGCGVRKDIEILNSTALATLLGDRHKFQPYGIFGGRPGRLGETVLISDGQEIQLGSKESRAIKQGDVISFRLSGAGGYGPPAERTRQRIQDDIADGYQTEEGARREYGYLPQAAE
ncbi:MAG: hydantoinase B/oxoprolinase family protein [Alphaproteobacteria bacterium]|nr:hydantoinase B/oxoprolinase family protein [Alphaproteobacteria bacterium]